MLMFFRATDYFTMWGIGVVSILCVIFIYTVVFIDSYYNVIVYGCLAKYSITLFTYTYGICYLLYRVF